MDEYTKGNQGLWDELTPIHAQSDFYDVEGFKNGRSGMLYPIELEEMGDVTGKSLLHLQCHFDMDTLLSYQANHWQKDKSGSGVRLQNWN